MAYVDLVTAASCFGSPDKIILLLILPCSEHRPAIGIKETGSWLQAASSMKMYEKCWDLNAGSNSRALTIQPAVSNVQTTMRNPYKYSSDGNLNSSFTKLQICWNLVHSISFLNDFAYIRKRSLLGKNFKSRSVISSHAAFELAHTNTYLFVVCTISRMAATRVLVFPVPISIFTYYCTYIII